MRQAGPPGPVIVEFDEHVPLTVTWERASETLAPPRYLRLLGAAGYLELKFHPVTGMLAETVLAAAPGLRLEQADFAPRALGDAGLMPFADTGGAPGELQGPLAVRAYLDCLCVSFGQPPAWWAVAGPVLFGVAGDQDLTALCARWTPPERETVLSGRLPAWGRTAGSGRTSAWLARMA